MLLVADFLKLYPEFNFDIEEYLISSIYSCYLQQRFFSFNDSLYKKNQINENKEKFIAILNKISNTVEAYSKLENIKRFEEIPYINKNSIRNRPACFINDQFSGFRLWHKDTSGTTGPPVAIFYSDQFHFEQLILTIRKIVNRAKILYAESRPVFCMAITDNRSVSDWVVVDPTKESGLSIQVVIDECNPETLRRLFNLIDFLKPAVITGKPSIFEMLLRYSDWLSNGTYSPNCIISSGALLDENLRENTQNLFKSKVFNAYGLTEFGIVASECPNQNGLHIDESSVIAEVIDHTGNIKGDGVEGELVLSSFSNMAMPLVRYRTGDLAILDSSLCSCGLAGPRLNRISGRKVLCFRSKLGDLFSPAHFNELFYLFPISEFQITQLSLTLFEVLVQPLPEFNQNADDLLEKIKKYIQMSLPFEVDVSILITTFNYNSKFERYRTLV